MYYETPGIGGQWQAIIRNPSPAMVFSDLLTEHTLLLPLPIGQEYTSTVGCGSFHLTAPAYFSAKCWNTESAPELGTLLPLCICRTATPGQVVVPTLVSF